MGLEDVDGVLGAAHVGALGDVAHTRVDESLGLVARDLVLGGRGQSNLELAGDVSPGARAGDVGELGGEFGGFGEFGELLAGNLELGNEGDFFRSERGRLVLDDERALAVGERDDGTAEIDNLVGGILGDVAGSRESDALAGEGFLSASDVLDHVFDVVDNTVAGGLGANQTASPVTTLAGQDTLPLVADLAVLAEEEADLAAGNTDVTSGDVSIGANVLAQLGHERDTEATDLLVRLALGVEVGATLGTAHVQSGQGILEDLLETEELEDGKVDGGVEAETTLVGAQGRVELHTEALVDLEAALVVLPDDAELDDALRDGNDLEGLAVFGVDLEEGRVLKSRSKLYAY